MNLPRVYQAFYAAFQGTGQKTVGPGRLPVSLNEVGIQTTPVAAVAGKYTGAENGEGVSSTGSEDYQAAWYAKLVDFALCDADITKVNIFKLVDETALEGWQSGLFYQGYVAKLSAAAFKAELAKTAGRCPAGQAAYFAPSAASGDQARAGEEGGRQEAGCEEAGREEGGRQEGGPESVEEGRQEGRQEEAAPEVRPRAARGQTRRQRSS